MKLCAHQKKWSTFTTPAKFVVWNGIIGIWRCTHAPQQLLQVYTKLFKHLFENSRLKSVRLITYFDTHGSYKNVYHYDHFSFFLTCIVIINKTTTVLSSDFLQAVVQRGIGISHETFAKKWGCRLPKRALQKTFAKSENVDFQNKPFTRDIRKKWECNDRFPRDIRTKVRL